MTAAEVLTRLELAIASEDDVVMVRRRVRALADARGFDAFGAAAITTATSEIARNVVMHGRGGRAIVREVSDGRRIGLQVDFEDQGPGISDVPRALAGGWSTARSLGLGLSGSKRLVDEFELDSESGRGTRVRLLKWMRA